MQRITLARARPGMIIAKSIFSAEGGLLLAGGTILTAGYISRMRKLGIYSLYIGRPDEEVEIPEALREKTRVMAVTKTKAIFDNLQTNQQVNVEAVRQVAASVVAELMNNKWAMVHLNDIRAYDDYTFGHSVNVCVLAVLTGIALGTMNRPRLEKLAMGALLHDVGKMMVPNKILNKPGKLNREEWKIMRRHSAYGFEILRARSQELSILSAHVALQHHEKFNGEGYPRGLRGTDIHEFARIVAVADVYDALTSDRAYNRALLPHQAYEILLAAENTHFDGEILQAFLERIAIYPVGCLVELNTGDIGMVVKVVPRLSARPTVRLLISGDGQRYSDKPEIDLLANPAIAISEVLAAEKLARVKLMLAGRIKRIGPAVSDAELSNILRECDAW